MSDDMTKRSVPFTPEQMAAASSNTYLSPVSGRRYALSSVTPSTWMGPSQPQAPQQQQVIGRQFDYPVGANLNYTPRSYETISFAQLRALADSYDLLRMVIETRKDQICKMQWKILSTDDSEKVEDDPRVKAIKALLMSPDRIHTWQTWLRMLLEDQLVIDAATIYPRKTLAGSLYSLDIIDGATIKVIIDQDGRRPMAPEPAYQQIIKGLPAVDYSADELIYLPRNCRSWKFYGCSNVEQVIMSVNIAMRRQLHQLHYYTEGNVPEALISCPLDWTPADIALMQKKFDEHLVGDTAQRRHAKFIPGGIDVTFTKDAVLKDDYDEWLARVVCFCFSISPTPFVKQVNRATAESAHEAALEEGLSPIMSWVKDAIDYIIVKYFGFDDLQFAWDDEESIDPKEQADINCAYVAAQILDIDEVRLTIGRDPRAKPDKGNDPDNSSGGAVGALGQSAAGGTGTSDSTTAPPGVQGQAVQVQSTAMNGAQVTALLELIDTVAGKKLPPDAARAMILISFPNADPKLVDDMLNALKDFEQPEPPAPIIAPGLPGAAAAPGAAKPGKPAPVVAAPAGKPTPVAAAPAGKPPAKPVTKAAPKELAKLTKALKKALAKLGKSIAKQVAAQRDEPEVGKARKPPVIATLNMSDLQDTSDTLTAAIADAATVGAAAGLAKAGVSRTSITNLANTRAERWAAERSGDLIGKAADGGELIDSTRDMIRQTISKAEQEGWSNAKLSNELQSSYTFSEARAETIARTELKMADSEGAMIGYRASGVVKGKQWYTSEDDACDECAGNEADGVVDLNDNFSSGDDTTPAHPNCNCSVSPVVDDSVDDN